MDKTNWTTVITPPGKFFNFNFRELFRYRDLIALFIRRDFVALYKQTILGPLWYIIQPLFTTLVFTLVFGRIAQMSTEGVPRLAFYMSGVILWTYFSNVLTKTSGTFITGMGIFKKVYFPRLVSPISVMCSEMISFAMQFLIFAGIYLYYFFVNGTIMPTWSLLLYPLLFLQVALLAFGIGILISSLTTKYRDLKFLVSFGVRLWMYATPIAYPISAIPEQWHWVMWLNPVTFPVEMVRYGLFGTGEIPWQMPAISLGMTVVILFIGLLIFARVEKNFADRV
jgi:lipopolysaccharide transport system permease protein